MFTATNRFVVTCLCLQLLERSNVQDSGMLTLVVEILPSLTITAINVVAAPLFQIIVAIEDYTPETEVRVTITRCVQYVVTSCTRPRRKCAPPSPGAL